MHPNSMKYKKNISLGSNGVDRVRSFRKIPTRLRGTNFCTSSPRFASNFVRQTNSPVRTQIVRKAPNRQFRVQWRGSGAFVAKNSDATSCHELLHQFVPFGTEFRKAAKWFQMYPNSAKRTKIFSLGSNGWIGCVRNEKFLCDFVVRTFALVPLILHQVS